MNCLRRSLVTVPPAAILAVVIVAALVARSADTPRLSGLPADAIILAFGDSLTRGTGAEPADSYPAVLARLADREVVNGGIPGELSAAGAARLAGLLDEVRPQLLILCHGGNDLLRKKDPGATRRNLERMLDAARERGIPTLLLGVPKPGIWLSTAEFYLELAEDTGTPIEADAVSDILGDNGLKADAVHPNAAGYRELAGRIHDKLKHLGAL